MGGNALSVETVRYSKNDYFRLVDEVQSKLDAIGIQSRVPVSFGAKDSFGDLDILILTESLNNKNVVEMINNVFSPNEIYGNSPVYSFDYKKFQIDFILTKTSDWDSAYHYFSYNDLGNLIGRITYKLGFRYGHYGLNLVYRHPDGGKKFYKNISRDIDKTLEFLGFDVERYHKGFYKLEETFDFIIESKYFNPRVFDYSELNHQNRTRNKKRKNYSVFLEYVKDMKGDYYEFESKDYYVKLAEDFFGIELVSEIENWKKKIEIDKMISAKFNGHIIMEKYPNLKGKELGNTIGKFKKTIDNWKEYVINNDVDNILSEFKLINNL